MKQAKQVILSFLDQLGYELQKKSPIQKPNK